jgi:hypothetical protein
VAKIEYAGANEGSFRQAAEALAHLAELSISTKHVQRITERLGRERAQHRDGDVERMKAGHLSALYRQPPTLAAIHLDAGKIQLRADDGPAGVRQPHWSDTKVACLQTYRSIASDQDPQPEPPGVFLDPPRVMRLCQEMGQVRGNPTTRPTAAKAQVPLAAEAVVERPKRLVRTAVATMQATDGFGWMVAAEAMRRGFYQAGHRAVVGDGGNWIEPLGQMHFPGWVHDRSCGGGLADKDGRRNPTRSGWAWDSRDRLVKKDCTWQQIPWVRSERSSWLWLGRRLTRCLARTARTVW